MSSFPSSVDAGVVSNVAWVGLKLPAYVNLNLEVDLMLPGLNRVASKSHLNAAAAQIMQGGVLKMDYSPCNRDVSSRMVKGCVSYISSGDYQFAVKWPESNVAAGNSTVHSSHVPLSSLLTFSEGDMDRAKLVSETGVDFAAVEAVATCDVASTPEISMEKATYFSLYSPRFQQFEFDSNWKKLVNEFDSIDAVSSPKTGPLTLSQSHHQSLMRTLRAAQKLIHEKYFENYIPRVKIVAAVCKNVTGEAEYGSHGKPFTRHPINLEEVILSNADFPGEYFAALLSFSVAPYHVPFM